MSDEVFPDTLYVSGLPEVDLDEIEETFSAFGSVDSIKFLDPDKKTAFVKFNTSHEADDAYKYSKGLLIKDTLVKIGWGRRSHLNPQPPKQAPTQQTQPPQQKQLKQLSSRDHSKSHSSGSSHHHDSHHRRSSGSSSSSSSYSTRSRPSSEQNNVSSNSDRLRSSNNDTQKEYPEKAPTEKPSLLQLPSKQEAQNGLPPNPLLLQELPLRPDQEEHLALLLRKLDGSMDSIKGLSSWIVSNTFSEFDVGPMVTSIVSEMQKADHSKKLFMLFVLTDVFCQKYLPAYIHTYTHTHSLTHSV